MNADQDDIAVIQFTFLNFLAIHIRTVKAVRILDEYRITFFLELSMASGHRLIVNNYAIFRLSPDSDKILIKRYLFYHGFFKFQ